MTDKLKCPFCGAELKKEMAGDIETGRLVCCTKNCPCIDQNLFPDVWELLTTGKRAQDALKVAINALKYVEKHEEDDYPNDVHYRIDLALRRITSITKREKRNEKMGS